MKAFLLCSLYLFVAISSVHSASYYYRAGREIIEPTVEETVKEVVAELKKEEVLPAVVIDDVDAVKKVDDSVVAPSVQVVQVAENNVIPEVKEVIVTEVVDEARGKIVPQQLRLEALEIVQPVNADKVATVAETVKNAAVEAIRTTNEDVVTNEVVKPIEKVPEPAVIPAAVIPVAETKIVEPVVVPVVEPIVDSVVVKSVPLVDIVETPQQAVVEAVKASEPVVAAVVETVETVQPVELKSQDSTSVAEPIVVVKEDASSVVPAAVDTVKVADELRSAVPAAEVSKPEVVVSETNVDVPKEKTKDVVPPAVRQQETPNPIIAPITNFLNQFNQNAQQTLQTITQNFPQGILNAFNRPNQQSDTPAEADATSEEANTVADNIEPIAEAAPTQAPASSPVAFIQNAFQNLLGGQRSTTAAPIVEAAPSDTRRDDDSSVEIVQNIEVADVDDKVDLVKKVE